MSKPATPSNTPLVVESSLHAVPAPLDDTPAGVIERLKRELALEQARVRHLSDQEREAWSVVTNLRTDLAAARGLARTQPGSAPLTPRVSDAGVMVPQPPPSGAKGTPLPLAPPKPTCRDVGSSTEPAEEDPVLRLLSDMLRHGMRSETELTPTSARGTPVEKDPRVVALKSLIAHRDRLERTVIDRDVTITRWQLWCQEAAARAVTTHETLLSLESLYTRDIGELAASNADRQGQISKLVDEIQRIRESQRQVPAVLPTEATHPLLAQMASKNAEQHKQISTIQNNFVATAAQLRATRLLLGRHRTEARQELMAYAALRGTPLSAWCFSSFFKARWREWTAAQTRPSSASEGGGCAVSVDDMVRVWRDFQVHCAERYVSCQPSPPSPSVITAVPLWEGQQDHDSWAGEYRAWLRLFGADALHGLVDQSATATPLPRPFKDRVAPDWHTDVTRMERALGELTGGFLPTTEYDWVRFWVLFSVRAGGVHVDVDGIRPASSEDMEAGIPRGAVLVAQQRLSELCAKEQVLRDVEIQRDLQTVRADNLDLAMRSLVAVHVEECTAVQQRAATQVENAIHVCLRSCPTTYRLFTALYAQPMSCSECGHHLSSDFALPLLTAAVERSSGIAPLTTAEFFNDMIAATAQHYSAVCAEAVLHEADTSDAVVPLPPVAFSLSPAAFAEFAASVSFRDETQVLSAVRQYLRRGLRAATEMTHADALRLARLIRFVWLPSKSIEKCLQEMPLMSLASRLDADNDIRTVHDALDKWIRDGVAAGARLKLQALSHCHELGGSSIAPRTPKEAAAALGVLATEKGALVAPRASLWVLDSLRNASDPVDFIDMRLTDSCESTWPTFAALQRALETPPS